MAQPRNPVGALGRDLSFGSVSTSDGARRSLFAANSWPAIAQTFRFPDPASLACFDKYTPARPRGEFLQFDHWRVRRAPCSAKPWGTLDRFAHEYPVSYPTVSCLTRMESGCWDKGLFEP